MSRPMNLAAVVGLMALAGAGDVINICDERVPQPYPEPRRREPEARPARTEADSERIMAAEQKRARKAAKLSQATPSDYMAIVGGGGR